MLPMIPREVDEVIAMGQHMIRSKRHGESLWSAFWRAAARRKLEILPENFGTVLKTSIGDDISRDACAICNAGILDKV